MRNDKLEQIASISNEVQELHPLLQEVFERHDQIARVEYTHGPSEMGADFILIRNHDVLKREEYIGVIAKRGKIHQNLSVLREQIHECLTVPRTLEGGKKKIHLTEVWVVATATITQGAKTKIHAAYKASKVHFVSGRDLAALVEEWAPHYWSDVPIETSSYLTALRTEAREQDERLDIIQVTGKPLYIAQHVDRVMVDPYNHSANSRRKRVKVDPLEELESHRFMLIEAGMGGGKSKLVRHLTQSIADRHLSSTTPWLPVSTTYKELIDEHAGSLKRCLDAKVPTVVQEQLQDDGRIIFLVDAMDEKEQSQDDMFAFLANIGDELEANYRYRLVLTSRIIGNLEFDKQFATTLTRYEIRRLTMGQLINYLKEVCKRLNLTNRIVDDVRRSPLFARLPKNPLAAVLLAQVLRDNPKDLPATLPELYSKYLELALGRWEIAKGLQSQQEYEVLEVVLTELARYFLENDLPAMSAEEFRHRIARYLDERNLTVDPAVIFSKAVGRSEVVVISHDERTISFKHRSFAEFLEAKRRVREGQVVPSLEAFEMYWANTYYFVCGEMKDAPELIDGLAALEPVEEQHRWLKPMNMANYVMAAYATPYRVIEEAVHNSIVEAAKLFCDIVDGKQKSFFGKLSRMDLLCLMQVIIRDHYGFEFLGSALEHAAIRVMDERPTEIAPYCLFLLSVASFDAGRTDAFESLVEEYQGEMPIDVSLGVVHEDGARSKIVKRFARKLRKKRKKSARLNRDISLLYDRPIIQIPRGE